MKINNAVCYSFSLSGEDPMAHLRLIGPLRQSGINIINGIENNQIIINRVSEADIIIIQRELPKKFDDYKKIVEFARKEGKPLIFDLDDLLFFLPENHPDRLDSYYGSSLLPMLQALMEADLVSVATPRLRDFVINYNNNVSVLPNYFDDNLWRLKSPVLNTSEHKTLTIGYMGGNSHRPDLEYITPVLLDLIKRYPQKLRFQFWGVQPPAEVASLTQVQWSPTTTYRYKDFATFFQTQTADIFIAPLIDTLFNRCKSPIKFFEYSALGVPGVFSRLETYTDVITHGHNGLLASSLDEWTNCLIQLIEDKELRFYLATNAQETIRSNWLLSQNAFRWEETFQSAFDIMSSKQNSHTASIVESINFQLFETFDKKEAAVQTLTAQVAEKEQAVAALTAQVAEKEQSVQALSAKLGEITISKAWRVAMLLRRTRIFLLPPGSWRERVGRALMRGWRLWRLRGFRDLWLKMFWKASMSALHIYHRLPLPMRARETLHRLMLRHAPSLVRGVDEQGKTGNATLERFRDPLRRDALERCLLKIYTNVPNSTHISHLITLPFLATGGAEFVAMNYARAVIDTIPDSMVILVVADSGKVSYKPSLPPRIILIVLEEFLQQPEHEYKLLLLHDLITSLRPRVVHNINSEVAWNLFIGDGEKLKRITNLFACIFAFQYNASGEKVGYAANFLRSALPYLLGLLTDNQRFINDAINEYQLQTEALKFSFIYNPSRALSDQTVDEARRRLADLPNRVLRTGRLRGVWAGRADAEKRIDLFLELVRTCEFADFEMYGHTVIDSNISLPTLNNLQYRGGFENADEVFGRNAYDAFIFTSRWEGMPNILLEAGTWGVPIIAPAVGGVGELVHEDTGYLLPANASLSDYLNALAAIMKYPEEAVRRGNNMVELLTQRHNWPSFLEGVKQIRGYLA